MTDTVRNADIPTSIRDGLERIIRGMILSEVTIMPECPNCGEEIGEDDNEWDCPFCGYEDWGDGFFHCYNCDTLFDWNGDLWECENCHNEGITKPRRRYIDYDDYEDDEYCEDGIPDVNQGWVGEHYG